MLQIVGLPGLLCTGAIYEDVARQLDSPINVIDLPPFDDFEEIAVQVAKSLPERCILVCLSMGSYLGFRIAKLAPEKVAGLVLIATTSSADSEEAVVMRSKTIRWAEKNGIDALAETIADAMLAPHNRTNAALRKTICNMARDTGLETFALHQKALASRPDQTQTLASIKCPCVVMTGAHDTVTPPAAGQFVAEAMPNASFHLIPDASHLALLEAPAVIASHIASLEASILQKAQVA